MRRWVSLLTLAIGLAIGASWGTHVALTRAQEPAADVCAVDATPEAVESDQRLLGQADYTGLPTEPARLTTTQITLAPGAATQPFANPGPVLIIVQDGTVTLTADEATIGAPPEDSGLLETTPPVPSPAVAVGVTRGEQISLNANVNALLANETGEAVRILLITLTPGA